MLFNISKTSSWQIVLCRYANAGIMIFISLFLFIIPGAITVHDLSDPNIRSAAIPRSAWKLHQALSPQFAQWAEERVNSKHAQLSVDDISGTEWPLFGAAFYLWATESLQDAWAKDHSLSPTAPNIYARRTIDAATALILDPAQAGWVKIHWGANYLKTENVFYRMLIIAALTSQTRLTGERSHLSLLREQTDSLAAELDASPHGLLDDYPWQCFPGDVVTAVAMIHKADTVLGTGHSAFVKRAARGFQNAALDEHGLVPYDADAKAGRPEGPARGCGNSYVSLFAPSVWPEPAHNWYNLYTKYYWQERWACVGFREFPNDLPGNDWNGNVDSGPVWGGFSCAGSAFGVGAARVNGHFEHAYPLTTEMLVTSWPLPNGTRLVPRLLSDVADAPYLGEAAMLFNLTRLPAEGMPIKMGGSMPALVPIFLTFQFGMGLLLLIGAVRSLHRWHKYKSTETVPQAAVQFKIWGCLLIAAISCLFCGKPLIALLLVLSAQVFPNYGKMKPWNLPEKYESS